MEEKTVKEVVARRKKHWVREYSEAILTAFLVAFVIRSFGIEAQVVGRTEPGNGEANRLLIEDAQGRYEYSL